MKTLETADVCNLNREQTDGGCVYECVQFSLQLADTIGVYGIGVR